jgi:hypothetical protein
VVALKDNDQSVHVSRAQKRKNMTKRGKSVKVKKGHANIPQDDSMEKFQNCWSTSKK